MSVPNYPITPIPNTEPEAIPSLWNTRYEEIDENFLSLDGRATALENEIAAAATAGGPGGPGGASLATTINAIIEQIGGIASGGVSSTAIRDALYLDWHYRKPRLFFELFMDGFRLQNHMGTAVAEGVLGDDSIDVASTAGFQVGWNYMLKEGDTTALVTLSHVLTQRRLRTVEDLEPFWTSAAVLTGNTMSPIPEGGCLGTVGDQWISKLINLGDDEQLRSVFVRRSVDGDVALYFRDGHTTDWTEVEGPGQTFAGQTNGVPAGFVDLEFRVPLRGDGFLRLEVLYGPVTVKHILAIGDACDCDLIMDAIHSLNERLGNYNGEGSSLTDFVNDIYSNVNSLQDRIDAFESVPPGVVAFCASSYQPYGWVFANGAAVSRSAYAGLFAVIGTTYGAGNGSTTFNLPDLRGEFIRGWDNGRGADYGRGFASWQGSDFTWHSHSVSAEGSISSSVSIDVGAGSEDGFGDQVVLVGPAGYVPFTKTFPVSGSVTISGTTSGAGGTETRPRNLALLPCIKY